MFGMRKKEQKGVHIDVQNENAPSKKTTEHCCGKKGTKSTANKGSSMKNCK